MVKMDITINNDVLSQIMHRLSKFAAKNTLPSTQGAVKLASSIIRDTWREYAGGGTLPGLDKLKNPSGGYARSIKINKIGPFDYEVISEAEIASMLENGTAPFDMKQTHTKGPRSRVSSDGVPYVIVPFRWGTPKAIGFKNIMPESVYAIVKAKKFQATRVTGSTHTEKNFNGDDVERQEYSSADGANSWGSTLTAEMGSDVTDRMEGMSKMKGQGGKSAGYYTFRVISAESPSYSWLYPGMKAKPITQAVLNYRKDSINDLIEHGIREDLGL